MPEHGLIVSRMEDVAVVDFRNAPVLHSAGVREMEPALHALIEEGKHVRLALDFTAVRFLASQMLGVLVSLHKKAELAGGRMVICGLPSNLYRVFQVSKLDTVLHFADSLAEGVRSVRGEDGEPPADALPPVGAQRGLRSFLNRQIRIFFAGALVLVPLAITVWVAWAVGAWLDALGRQACESLGLPIQPPPGTGALLIVAGVYVFGLMTHVWLFRLFFSLLERIVTRVPGIKTIYESVRDMMGLFGGGAEKMGRVVQYQMPETDMTCLGVLTNEDPLGLPADDPHRKVAVYLPLSYMIGGPTVLVSPENICDVDMSVEQCMKVCATAVVGTEPIVPRPKVEGNSKSEIRNPKET